MSGNNLHTGPAGNTWFFENVNLYSIFCPHKFGEYRENHQFGNFNKGEFIYFDDYPPSPDQPPD